MIRRSSSRHSAAVRFRLSVRLALLAGLLALAACRNVHSPDVRSMSTPYRDPKGLEYVNGSMEGLEQLLDGLDRQIENAVY
ncbi:MAG: hypothetical protein IT450_08480 [Phycisphaerales bacterium]|nr:hypothetical protein [Phycisphaerales bacterium]